MTMLAELSAGPWVAAAEMGTMLPGSPKVCVCGVKGKMLSLLLVGGAGVTLPCTLRHPLPSLPWFLGPHFYSTGW